MYVNEFLQRTELRNRNAQIERRVQQQMRACVQDLEQRRLQLARQLHGEEQQQQRQLEQLQQAAADSAQNKRIEWIQLAVMQNEKADQELIEQKKLQREIENSEEQRHLETKQLLLATKQAQLYQIEELRARRRRAAYLNKQWQLS
ncbi:hypothetical protein KR222_008081 [Zaprionus bogoriensis]|nr:hypothetical protein KR222_008081 [Zaprionus bogoriensis]